MVTQMPGSIAVQDAESATVRMPKIVTAQVSASRQQTMVINDDAGVRIAFPLLAMLAMADISCHYGKFLQDFSSSAPA